jgi:NarL family two-component system response regulator LiaR
MVEDASAAVKPLSVLIVDDHPLMLAGLRRAFERSDGLEVVGEAHSPAEALALIERRRPEVVLMDLRMPGVQGTEHIEQVRERWPDVKVIVLSATEDQTAIDQALAAGASAFIVKSISPSDIPAILRQVASGAVFHAPGRARSWGGGGSAAPEPPAGPELTERERSILGAVARGLTTSEIGRELFISEHTVKFHLTNLYRKLGVSNRTAAVRYALENGLAGPG